MYKSQLADYMLDTVAKLYKKTIAAYRSTNCAVLKMYLPLRKPANVFSLAGAIVCASGGED